MNEQVRCETCGLPIASGRAIRICRRTGKEAPTLVGAFFAIVATAFWGFMGFALLGLAVFLLQIPSLFQALPPFFLLGVVIIPLLNFLKDIRNWAQAEPAIEYYCSGCNRTWSVTVFCSPGLPLRSTARSVPPKVTVEKTVVSLNTVENVVTYEHMKSEEDGPKRAEKSARSAE